MNSCCYCLFFNSFKPFRDCFSFKTAHSVARILSNWHSIWHFLPSTLDILRSPLGTFHKFTIFILFYTLTLQNMWHISWGITIFPICFPTHVNVHVHKKSTLLARETSKWLESLLFLTINISTVNKKYSKTVVRPNNSVFQFQCRTCAPPPPPPLSALHWRPAFVTSIRVIFQYNYY